MSKKGLRHFVIRGLGFRVGTFVVQYACSDCAISVVAAPLLVSREAALTARKVVQIGRSS